MSPYIMLNDTASVSRTVDHMKNAGAKAEFGLISKPETFMGDFLSSIGFALAEKRLYSETCHQSSLDYSIHNRPCHNQEASNIIQSGLDYTKVQSDYTIQPRGKVNRFEIMRKGIFIAVVLLGRPAFRLGERISVVVDFQQSAVHCHSLTATLESFEIVDPTVALRSQASIYRATRRIHASRFELTLHEKRATFSFTPPSHATPNFQTSIISLAWTLRFAFMISQKNVNDIQDGFLTEVVRNEKETISTGVQFLSCEKFEVSIPLIVYACGLNSYLKNKINEFIM